MIVQTF